MAIRPQFKEIKSYQEFSKYYWYSSELKQICKEIGLDYRGSKLELNHNIEEYFNGIVIKKKQHFPKAKKIVDELTLDTKLIECGFCFNQKFRDFFIEQTGLSNFKFNADMVATSRKVKEDNDSSFTLQDMLDIYYGKKEYVKFDNSACQWNKFLKDFCADENSNKYHNKLKVASILWKEVRNSTREKIYTKDLLSEFENQKKAVKIREIKKTEYDVLEHFLYEAIYVPKGTHKPSRKIINQPELQIYINNFGQENDHCLVAELEGKIIGACWVRIMNDYGHLDENTPSLAISVDEQYRGYGVGTQLMEQMIKLLCLKGYKQISLSVQKDNKALKLYQKVGFEIVGEKGAEYLMLCKL